MTDRAIAIIQARMSSSRLSGKVMMPLAGRPMIWHIVQRARACELVSEVVVAISSEPSDDVLADLCAKRSIKCHRGSLNNVLSRYTDILDAGSYDYCVRITGDCPLIDPASIDQQILVLRQHKADFIWLTDPVTVLEGQGVHSVRSLSYIAERTRHPDDFEHVGSRYISEYPEQFQIIGMRPPKSLSDLNWRVTVDESRDYELMESLYDDLFVGQPIPLSKALDWLAKNPDKSGLNKGVKHSSINRELALCRQRWRCNVKIFCDWGLDQ